MRIVNDLFLVDAGRVIGGGSDVLGGGIGRSHASCGMRGRWGDDVAGEMALDVLDDDDGVIDH